MALWTTSLNAVTSFSQQLVCVSHLYAFKRHWNAYENRKNNIQNNKMNSHFKLLSGSHMEPIPNWKPAFVWWGISVITIKEGVGCISNNNKQLCEPRMLSGQDNRKASVQISSSLHAERRSKRTRKAWTGWNYGLANRYIISQMFKMLFCFFLKIAVGDVVAKSVLVV